MARRWPSDRCQRLPGNPSHSLRPTVVWLLAAAVGSVTPSAAQDPDGPPPVAEVVAIVGFTNLGGDPALDWIGPGTVASVRVDLRSVGFRTVGPEAVQAVLAERDDLAVDPARTAAEVGAVLGARWIVVGSYQRLGPRLRLTARLYEPTSDEEVSVIRSEGLRADVFDLQDQIAEQLGARMRLGSRVAESAVSIDPSTDGFPTPAAVIDGPPPPEPPAVISRDAAGRATVRAVRLAAPLRLDGTLDEQVYQDVPAVSGFIQMEPVQGAPATEETEVWVLFDRDHIYVTGRCWDSAPESQWVVNEMRRDSNSNYQNENITFLLDTFYDRRNAVYLMVTPIGGRMDAQVTDERDYNGDWNPIWDVETGRFEGGWTFEAAVPFKSLRYNPGREQVWGLQVRRMVRWKNETSLLTSIPAIPGAMGVFLMSLAATLVDLEVPEAGRTLDIKPYAITDLTSNRTVTPPVSNQLGGDVGLDVKYGVTQNLVADLTVNTDFAQVEADEQQVNLTRFSLFFPEKREFFLENRGLFSFGGPLGRAAPRRSSFTAAASGYRRGRRFRSTWAAG